MARINSEAASLRILNSFEQVGVSRSHQKRAQKVEGSADQVTSVYDKKNPHKAILSEKFQLTQTVTWHRDTVKSPQKSQ